MCVFTTVRLPRLVPLRLEPSLDDLRDFRPTRLLMLMQEQRERKQTTMSYHCNHCVSGHCMYVSLCACVSQRTDECVFIYV